MYSPEAWCDRNEDVGFFPSDFLEVITNFGNLLTSQCTQFMNCPWWHRAHSWLWQGYSIAKGYSFSIYLTANSTKRKPESNFTRSRRIHLCDIHNFCNQGIIDMDTIRNLNHKLPCLRAGLAKIHSQHNNS